MRKLIARSTLRGRTIRPTLVARPTMRKLIEFQQFSDLSRAHRLPWYKLENRPMELHEIILFLGLRCLRACNGDQGAAFEEDEEDDQPQVEAAASPRPRAHEPGSKRSFQQIMEKFDKHFDRRTKAPAPMRMPNPNLGRWKRSTLPKRRPSTTISSARRLR